MNALLHNTIGREKPVPMYEDHYDGGDGWVPGVDFDPSDQDEMEIMRVVWEKEKYDRIASLEREIQTLRAALAAKRSDCNECGKDAMCLQHDDGQMYCGSCLNEIKYEAAMYARDAEYVFGNDYD